MITRGNSKDATKRDRDLSSARSKHLRERCAPFFLRREKKDVLKEPRSPTSPSSPLTPVNPLSEIVAVQKALCDNQTRFQGR